jgi:hypothetical protein
MAVVCGFISGSSIPWIPFCTSTHTMLFLLPWLCSVSWKKIFWYLLHCSFCWGLHWLLCFHMNFKIFFLFLLRISLQFWWELYWICRSLLVI